MKSAFKIITTAAAFFLISLGAVMAQSAPTKYLSAASNNSTLVRTGKTLLRTIVAVNTTSTIYYLKFYDKATAPTCGTDVPKLTIPVPNTTSNGSAVPISSIDGFQFQQGLGFCLVAGIADTDNTNAATGVAINLGASGS